MVCRNGSQILVGGGLLVMFGSYFIPDRTLAVFVQKSGRLSVLVAFPAMCGTVGSTVVFVD
jgi:hypothetical protein